jgi:NAD(P)-dependent dehydrogenase (short-subunit alcohol dehydrogenase family)
MTGIMKGKRGLIMGVANNHSIAWGISKAAASQGAELAFTYQGEALGKRVKPLAAEVGSDFLLPCDVEDIASVDATFEAIKRALGQARLPRPRHRLFRQERAEGPLCRYHAGQFLAHHGHLLLLLHGGRQTRGRV